jgi:plasmid stability protein
MPALDAYNACIMKRRKKQYTIRGIPERLDARMREKAAEYGKSINSAALEALSKGLGLEADSVVHNDLDDLAGTWVQDDEFDSAIESMDQVDGDLWR